VSTLSLQWNLHFILHKFWPTAARFDGTVTPITLIYESPLSLARLILVNISWTKVWVKVFYLDYGATSISEECRTAGYRIAPVRQPFTLVLGLPLQVNRGAGECVFTAACPRLLHFSSEDRTPDQRTASWVLYQLSYRATQVKVSG